MILTAEPVEVKVTEGCEADAGVSDRANDWESERSWCGSLGRMRSMVQEGRQEPAAGADDGCATREWVSK